jgi:serine protease Do
MKQTVLFGLVLITGFVCGMSFTNRRAETAAFIIPPSLETSPAIPDKPTPETDRPLPPSVVAERPYLVLQDFSGVASRTIASVTNISSLQTIQRRRSPFMNDPFFQYFFKQDQDIFGGHSRREASLGSGVIVSSDGYVLTNQRELRGQLVGVDRWTDLALIKINLQDLPVMPWGDSSSLKTAEWVLAIGNPFQLSQTVTLGIISAVGRANVGIATYEDFIQTDAAINPGNSGGALVNAKGELVGINTAIYSETGGYQGVGFAVPSNLAQRVMNDLIEYGYVRRGSIGYLEFTDLTTQLTEQLNVLSGEGTLVSRMRRDSSAYTSGLRPGDVIINFDGQPITNSSHFLRLLSDAQIGTTATLGIIRDRTEHEINVKISQAKVRQR